MIVSQLISQRFNKKKREYFRKTMTEDNSHLEFNELCQEIEDWNNHRLRMKQVMENMRRVTIGYLKLGGPGRTIKEQNEALFGDRLGYSCFSWRFTRLCGVKKCSCCYCKQEADFRRQVRSQQQVINCCSHLPWITEDATGQEIIQYQIYEADPELSLEPEIGAVEANTVITTDTMNLDHWPDMIQHFHPRGMEDNPQYDWFSDEAEEEDHWTQVRKWHQRGIYIGARIEPLELNFPGRRSASPPRSPDRPSRENLALDPGPPPRS